MGVSKSWLMPAFSSLPPRPHWFPFGLLRLIRIRKMQVAETRTKPHPGKTPSGCRRPAIRPEAAKPTAVAPKALMAISEFAEPFLLGGHFGSMLHGRVKELPDGAGDQHNDIKPDNVVRDRKGIRNTSTARSRSAAIIWPCG